MKPPRQQVRTLKDRPQPPQQSQLDYLREKYPSPWPKYIGLLEEELRLTQELAENRRKQIELLQKRASIREARHIGALPDTEQTHGSQTGETSS